MALEDEGRSMELVTSFRTDFGQGDSYQKTIITCPGTDLFCTIGTDSYARIWLYGELKHEIHAGEEVISAAFNADASCLIIATAAHIKIYSLKTKQTELVQKPRDNHEYRCLLATGDKLLVVENRKDRSGSRISSWSLSNLRLLRSTTLSVKKAVTTIATTKEGDFLAFSSADGTVGILSTSTLGVIRTVSNLHSLSVTSVQITNSVEGLCLISGSPDGTVKITKCRPQRSFSFVILLFTLLAIIISYLVKAYPEQTLELIHITEDYVENLLGKLL